MRKRKAKKKPEQPGRSARGVGRAMLRYLGAIPWKHPGIVGPVSAAITAGLFAIVLQAMMPNPAPDNKPSNVFKPSIGLDEKDVGQEVSKALDPLRQDIEALSEQLATAELAPKQPLPDSEGPLKVMAVEFFNAGVRAYNEGEIGQALGHWLDAIKLDPDHARAHYNLAELYRRQGKYDRAVPMYKRSLEILRKPLGAEHLDMAASLNNLAALYFAQGKYEQAEPLFKNALAIYEHALGPEHPDVAFSLNNLALLYYTQGKYDDAEPLYKRSLAIRENVLGHDHPDVAQGLENYSALLEATGRQDEAQALLDRAAAIRKKSEE